jgi:hypothetical protein
MKIATAKLITAAYIAPKPPQPDADAEPQRHLVVVIDKWVPASVKRQMLIAAQARRLKLDAWAYEVALESSGGPEDAQCTVCGGRLSQCGSPDADGEPEVDCIVCQLREKIASLEASLNFWATQRMNAAADAINKNNA